MMDTTKRLYGAQFDYGSDVDNEDFRRAEDVYEQEWPSADELEADVDNEC